MKWEYWEERGRDTMMSEEFPALKFLHAKCPGHSKEGDQDKLQDREFQHAPNRGCMFPGKGIPARRPRQVQFITERVGLEGRWPEDWGDRQQSHEV